MSVLLCGVSEIFGEVIFVGNCFPPGTFGVLTHQ